MSKENREPPLPAGDPRTRTAPERRQRDRVSTEMPPRPPTHARFPRLGAT